MGGNLPQQHHKWRRNLKTAITIRIFFNRATRIFNFVKKIQFSEGLGGQKRNWQNPVDNNIANCMCLSDMITIIDRLFSSCLSWLLW